MTAQHVDCAMYQGLPHVGARCCQALKLGLQQKSVGPGPYALNLTAQSISAMPCVLDIYV